MEELIVRYLVIGGVFLVGCFFYGAVCEVQRLVRDRRYRKMILRPGYWYTKES